MDAEISAYQQAYASLDVAETALNKKVEAAMSKCTGIDDYYALIDELPKHYHGVRRIYQKIEELKLEESA